MPSLQINSANVKTFQFSVTFDTQNRLVIFDTSLTTYQGGGAAAILGIAFSVVDSQGTTLATIDFTSSQIPHPNITPTYTLDLSSVGFPFIFQQFAIIGALKEANGTVYSTLPVYPAICQPDNMTESGYVPGMFQVIANCPDNVLTIKDLTPFILKGNMPLSITKNGTLYYPTGSISPVTFTSTPFSNNQIFTGSNNVKCTAVATYDLGNNIYELITYITNQNFSVTCSNRIGDLMCCITQILKTAKTRCNDAIGQRAKQQTWDILPYYVAGLAKEINGQDASIEADFIRKSLACDCGSTSLGQNEMTPINPAVTSIVLTPAGGTTIPSTSISGDTKTFVIASNTYIVGKGDIGDLAFDIEIDTSTQYQVKYNITFNYNIQAGYILNAISEDNTLLGQLNSLISFTNTNIDLSNLNGSCVIDISSINYFLSFIVPSGATIVKNIIIGSTTYNAPGGLVVSNTDGIVAWLDGLSLGTFEASFSNGISGSYINILSVGNANNPVSVTFTISGSDTTVLFQKTNKSLIAVLQAIIDYLCGMTALQVALGQQLNFCYFDYNGNLVTASLSTTNKQSDFNSTAASAICNIVSQIQTLTGITCAKLQAIFIDRPNASFGTSDRIFGTLGGNCSGLTDQQMANMFIAAINKYSDVKAAFCAIDCSVAPTCPDIANTNISVISGNIGVYGVTYTSTPTGSQTATVRYRITGTLTWTIATSALLLLPNGNVSTSPPFLITGLTAGQTYDVLITNNCGGAGFQKPITIPTNPVFSGSFRRDTIIYNICGDSNVTLYSSSTFATGVKMFTDIGLTTPLTGFTFIADNTGAIYHIDSGTGIVGANTGSSCSTGTSGNYILGNSTATICSGSIVQKFTNGAFAVGGTLYNDSGLTSPVTGFAYVVNAADNHIYNLNPSTGAIISDTGLSCSLGTIQINNSFVGTNIANITVNGVPVVLSSGSFPLAPGAFVTSTTTQIGTQSVVVTISGSVAIGQCIEVFNSLGVLVGCQNTDGSTTVFTFGSVLINSSGTANITALPNPC